MSDERVQETRLSAEWLDDFDAYAARLMREKKQTSIRNLAHAMRAVIARVRELESQLAALSPREGEGGRDTERLERFVGAVLIESRLASEDSGEIDGWTLQEMAEAHGMIEGHEVTKPCGESCGCAEFGFPLTCYRFTGPAQSAIRAFRAWEDAKRAALSQEEQR